MSERLRVGVVGCGVISGAYLENAGWLDHVEYVAVADIDLERARARGAEHGLPHGTPEWLLGLDEVDAVLDLTIPAAHAEVRQAGLAAGKHVYGEKPLTVTLDEGRALVGRAAAADRRLGCAPDTFLGGGFQAARQALDDGVIGRPVGATALFSTRGPEAWHPDPAFLYAPGAGPLFDVGVYYLTALVALLGPIARVAAGGRRSRETAVIGSGPRQGTSFPVLVDTYVAGVVEFAGGALATLTATFDASVPGRPPLLVHGTEATLAASDPNAFGGPLALWRRRQEDEPIEVPSAWSRDWRGIGLDEMAQAIAEGRPHRASGELALHVLEAMHAMTRAARERRWVDLETTCAQPEPYRLDVPAAGPVRSAGRRT